MDIANAIIQHSGIVINWCLSIIGGSILVIIGSDYTRPQSKKIRLFYFLFVPGWFFLGYTIKLGINVANYGIIALIMQKEESKSIQILTNMGTDYSKQLLFFNIGLLFFGIWLLIFLISWVYNKI